MRSIFGSSSEQGSQFLQHLRDKIHVGEFHLLNEEGGFTAPNDYLSVKSLEEVLNANEFPREEFYEYQWAIYGCELNRLREYSVWMQLFLASLYVYCNKRKQWGITVDSDFYYLAITLALQESQCDEISILYLSFLEWLQDHVESDVGYDDYYCLLTWALLRRLTGTTSHACFLNVVDLLIEKGYSASDIETLTESEYGIDAWNELHQRIYCPAQLKTQFDRIIQGVEPALQ